SRDLRARPCAGGPTSVSRVPQPGLLRPRADAAPRQPARRLSPQGDARVPERGEDRLRRDDAGRAQRAERGRPARPRPYLRPPAAPVVRPRAAHRVVNETTPATGV